MTTEVLPDLRARLVRRARRLGADAVSAEDLAQETLAEGWRLRHRLTDPAGIERWDYAILRNVYLRWAARREEVLPVADRTDDGVDVEVQLERRELAELLDRALAALPEQTREVLVRRFVEESPIREVAARLGLSEGAVQMRLARGKLALRQALARSSTHPSHRLPGARIRRRTGGPDELCTGRRRSSLRRRADPRHVPADHGEHLVIAVGCVPPVPTAFHRGMFMPLRNARRKDDA